MSKKGTIKNPAKVEIHITWKQLEKLIAILDKHGIRWSMTGEPIYGGEEDKNEKTDEG